MRKLLINSTAIATVAALTASVAFAGTNEGLSISATSEMKYKSRTSEVAATNGTTTVSDSEVVFKFSNKTDSGLTIGYTVEMDAEGAATAIDEASLSISGGFGTVVLGENDGAGDRFGISALDLIAEESTDSVASARISTSADLISGNGDTTKIVYLIPAMGGFTAGVSQSDAGAATGGDTTSMGVAYAIESNGSTVTLGGASTTTASTTAKDNSSNNIGLKFVSGDLKVTVAKGTFEGVDEDRNATGVAASYKLANGITLGAYMVASDDDADASEAYDVSGVEAQYTIAAGLTAVVNVNDYDYKRGNAADADMSAVNNKGSSTSLTIKAAF